MAVDPYILPGRITKVEIGLSAGTNCDIVNVILFNWERVHEVRPHLVASTKLPYGTDPWLQGHSWVMGSFSLLTDHHLCIYATDVQAAGGAQYAYIENADSNYMDYFVVTYVDSVGVTRTTTFTKGLIYRATKELLNYDDAVWVYHFVAQYATDA
jgi:hypothetical protein